MFDHRQVVFKVLVLVAIFASGCFEAFVLKQKSLACITWFFCLAALAAWIAAFQTLTAIVIATVLFTSGLWLLIVYYRIWATNHKSDSENSMRSA